MKKLSHLEDFRMNEENDLFGNADMRDIDKIQTYCSELLGTDLVAPETPEGNQLRDALAKFTEGVNGLRDLLTELDGNEILPYDTEGSLPEPDEIIGLLK